MCLHCYSMCPSADNDAVVVAAADEYVVDAAAAAAAVDDGVDCTFYQKCMPQ